MSDNASPVAHLLRLGQSELDDWADYSTYGIGPQNIPELIVLLRDEALGQTGDGPEAYAQVHAWRALAQLKAEAAIEPLLDLLAGQELKEDWDEWITEGVPEALGRIGLPALGPTADRLEQTFAVHAPVYYAEALTAMAKHYPETRDQVVQRLSAYLDRASEHDPSTNERIICNLIELKATESWPTIERAFAAGVVNESLLGNVEFVKYDLDLGPKPEGFRYPDLEPLHRTLSASPSPSSARARAEKRSSRKKSLKRKEKRGRR